MDLLQGQLDDNVIEHLSKQIGGASKEQTATAASGILSTLMAALAKNAAAPGGAGALSAALDRDHDGSILDDVVGMMSGQKQAANPSMLNGSGILKHVLGGNQGNVIDMISKMSGLQSGNAGSLLQILAPLVMGALGRQKKQQHLDDNGLSDFLNKSVQSASAKHAEMGVIGKLLDRDGDGSVMDDIAGMGMNILGKFLRK